MGCGDAGDDLFVSIDVTAISTTMDLLCGMVGTLFLQEISAPNSAIRGLEVGFVASGVKALLGAPEPMARKALVGVGALDLECHLFEEGGPTCERRAPRPRHRTREGGHLLGNAEGRGCWYLLQCLSLAGVDSSATDRNKVDSLLKRRVG